ncbi:sugar phosphate isomerase/epimerase family protein [Fluviispira sanaruensis]|uniref:sugar phosphate isomerase/epimerase family protein n=1 Tax=Fluviispira sanaruensis TaxID=2493639 RepID=UPI001C1E2441|nr:sugar phosphate isomerase/epimerase family protein [Fluviispira sanaruensis]
MRKVKVGIMQGRLLPKYKERFQAHPIGYWQDEFPLASTLNLDCIEFILDCNDYEKNPLIYTGGIEEILKISKQTNVEVLSICADFFMECSLHNNDSYKVREGIEILKHLISISPKLGVKNIVIPCVDSSSLNTEQDKNKFVNSLSECLIDAEKNSVCLALETDLNPFDFYNLLKMFPSENVKVNYDIGNSASIGYNPCEEFKNYGSLITNIHIKDRIKNGKSVFFGKGDACFENVFNELKKINYSGILIMQAYRDDQGVSIFIEQYNWIKKIINNYLELNL